MLGPATKHKYKVLKKTCYNIAIIAEEDRMPAATSKMTYLDVSEREVGGCQHAIRGTGRDNMEIGIKHQYM